MTYPGWQYVPPPPPPKPKRTGLWVGLTFTAAVLLALLITGFVAPGFFLGKNKIDPAAGPSKTAQQIVDGLNHQDKASLTGLRCADAGPTVDTAVRTVDRVESATVDGAVVKVSETEYRSTMRVSSQGRVNPFVNTIVSENAHWCWKNITNEDSRSGDSPRSPTTTKSA
ncbi:hypothetical protein AB5J62_41435 [Amycolatopsis sp. cg5]|uniref:hypothetical protein n=1 Tax=Amycolatopsis sp. cg5 TaxID=3238802 RepID=UPI0035257215